MSGSTALAAVRDRLPAKIIDIEERSPARVYVHIEPDGIVAASRFMFEECGARLATVSAVDMRSGIELVYHWMCAKDHQFITIETKVKKPFPEIDSVGSFLPAAVWIEREIHDILGVVFRDHPDFRKLIFSDDWPEGVHPLRRGVRFGEFKA
jgi:NADH-quinone oxidoreductase subunit C